MKETVIIAIIKSVWDNFLRDEIHGLVANSESQIDDKLFEILDKIIST